MAANAMTGRKKRLWLSSAAGVALVCVIMVSANVASRYAYARLDLSRGRLYSISGGTRRVLAALPDPVLIRVYGSKELPPTIAASLRYLRDLLREYSAASGGKVRVRFVEIGDSSKDREEAVRSGVAPVRFDIFSKEKYEQREGFLGLTIRYQDKKDVIPYLQDTGGLEYELTSRIKTLSSTRKPALGFAKIQRSIAKDALDPALLERLSARYDVQDVDLESVGVDSGIPAGIGTLFLLGPQGRVSDKALFLLDQYLLSGRALCVAVDTKRIDTRNFYAGDLDTGLLPWLKARGIEVEPTLALDTQSQPIQVSMRQGAFVVTNIVQYPPMILATKLDPEHPVTQRLDSLVVPFASPLRVAQDSTVLVRSSPYSWSKRPGSGSLMSINPFQFPPYSSEDEKGPFALAAARVQAFQPFWNQPPAGVHAKSFLTKASGPSRLAVIGTSKIFSPEFKSQDNDGIFFMNLADWLSQDTDLISIRSKAAAFIAMREVPASVKEALRWIDIFAPPALAVAVGLWMWRRRSGRRLRSRAEYGAPPADAASARA